MRPVFEPPPPHAEPVASHADFSGLRDIMGYHGKKRASNLWAGENGRLENGLASAPLQLVLPLMVLDHAIALYRLRNWVLIIHEKHSHHAQPGWNHGLFDASSGWRAVKSDREVLEAR